MGAGRDEPKAGGPCAAAAGSPDCGAGLSCDTDFLCHPVNRRGQPCVGDNGCASVTCKDGKCVRPEECTR